MAAVSGASYVQPLPSSNIKACYRRTKAHQILASKGPQVTLYRMLYSLIRINASEQECRLSTVAELSLIGEKKIGVVPLIRNTN